MTEAEIMELITIKRQTLEDYRAKTPTASATTIKIMEDEIKQLESSLVKANAAPKRTGSKKIFLDECAG
jgi:hypothetical protein